MKDGLTQGHTAELHATVGAEQSIHLGAESGAAGVVVFATPAMINLMEHAARRALAPYLDEDEESVGVTVDVQHLAGTPISAAVRAEAEVTAVDGKMIDFEIRAFDGLEQIGRGTHRRAVVRLGKLADKLAEKARQLPEPSTMHPEPIEPNTGDLPALSTLAVERDGPVALVTLNRPKQLNAVNVQMTEDWEKLIGWLAGHEESVRVVIVTGSGRAFCAGDDVKEVGTLSTEAATQLSHRQARLYLALERLGQPIIAAVNGDCFGGGCVAAYSCDFRIASSGARFGMPEIKLGWAPGYGISQLTALVGKARAMELCLTGKHIDARTAQDWGLVNDVVPGNRLLPEARKLADQLLATPPIALRETKRLIHADEGDRPKVNYLADTAAYIRCLKTDDATEGIAAFAEKRSPNFRGR